MQVRWTVLPTATYTVWCTTTKLSMINQHGEGMIFRDQLLQQARGRAYIVGLHHAWSASESTGLTIPINTLLVISETNVPSLPPALELTIKPEHPITIRCHQWRFCTVHGQGPQYLTDICLPFSDVSSRQYLRSATRWFMVVSRIVVWRFLFKKDEVFNFFL